MASIKYFMLLWSFDVSKRHECMDKAIGYWLKAMADGSWHGGPDFRIWATISEYTPCRHGPWKYVAFTSCVKPYFPGLLSRRRQRV